MKVISFELFATDNYIFKNEKIGVIILLYINDLLIIGKIQRDIDAVAGALASMFEIKDIGNVISFLGYSIIKDRLNYYIYLYQEVYLRKIIERFSKEKLNVVLILQLPNKFELPKLGWLVLNFYSIIKEYQE